MQFSTSFIAAAAAFLPLINAHIVMVEPAPYAGTTNNSPLEANGSNFPCKFAGGVGTKGSPATTYTPGVDATFSLMGSAVHGGGSCQASITYDNPPTKDSVFKVVQSYHGGCPISAKENLAPDAENKLPGIPVKLPEGLKAGEAVFVWTWFNKIGNREMYMNCAPITIGGSGSSDDVFNGLPDMFVANINGAPKNACTTKEGLEIIFPKAGSNIRIVDGGAFGAACEGGSSDPGSDNGGSTPPAATTAPALNEGGNTATAAPTFSGIDSQPTMMPPVQTTMMTMPTQAPVPTQPIVEEPPVAQPTGGNNNNSGSGETTCNPSSESIMCGSDPSMYSQCFMDGIARGPYAVPPGTVCDSTGMGGFKAMSAVSTRFLRRSARFHRRNLVHAHSF